MFTGIVQEIGHVTHLRPSGANLQLTVSAPRLAPRLQVGDSICVSGACLTAIGTSADTFTAELTPETLRRTTLGRLRPGSPVNLEPALRLGEPLGGHWVQGHVDGVGRVTDWQPMGETATMTVAVPAPLQPYLVEKGSVAVDGVSLTIAALTPEGFQVALIPHTLAVTTLGRLRPGDEVNIETDILGKYVARLLAAYGLGQAPAGSTATPGQPGHPPSQPAGLGPSDSLRLHGFA